METPATRCLPLPIAGDESALQPQQRELIGRAGELGRDRFAPRAARHDREASFPAENFADLREAGLLALCVPREYGGLGADLATCALVTAEIGRHCGSTALAFSMHTSPCLWAGWVADGLDMSPEQRGSHERRRRAQFERIVAGAHFAQPFSEGGAASAGKAAWATLARKVEGGFLVSGRKIFASGAGAADAYAVPCSPDRPGATLRDALYLVLPAGAAGLSVTGDWDPLGMRATASRTLALDAVFVADDAQLLPEGLLFQAGQRFPHMFHALAPTYLGLAQAAYDFAVAYLRAEWPGMASVKRRVYPAKQRAVADMRVLLEQTRALFLQTLREARADPDDAARQRLYAAHFTVMENAAALSALALRTCGGQAMLKSLPLERIHRDARCGSLMLPWTAELCLDRLGRESLYSAGEGDEAID